MILILERTPCSSLFILGLEEKTFSSIHKSVISDLTWQLFVLPGERWSLFCPQFKPNACLTWSLKKALLFLSSDLPRNSASFLTQINPVQSLNTRVTWHSVPKEIICTGKEFYPHNLQFFERFNWTPINSEQIETWLVVLLIKIFWKWLVNIQSSDNKSTC